jgi:hypothetical protein
MNSSLSNPSLWQQLSDFQLDDSPEAAVQFSDKLIKETKWTPDFAKRAMAEYKKFLYLCLTMPQGASPSGGGGGGPKSPFLSPSPREGRGGGRGAMNPSGWTG